MRKRTFELLGVAAIVAGVAAVLVMLDVGTRRVEGQTQSSLKTVWGEPDLEGLWAQAYQIPMQRPAKDADKPLLTDAEVAERTAERDKPKPPAPNRGDRVAKRGTLEDLAGAYDITFEIPADAKRPIGHRTSLIIDPPDGRMPRQTAEVQKRMRDLREFQLALMQSVETCKDSQEINCFGVKYTGKVSPRYNEPAPSYIAVSINGDRVLNRADNPEDWGLGERCLSEHLPVMGAVQRIVQSPGSVSIVYEGSQRVIPITTAPHLPSSIRQWMGDSRGRWEGNTLVVDTTNFTPKTDYEGSRENLHLIERFTRIDAHMLDYVVTLEDPTAWEKPWTVKIEMAMQDQKANALYDEPRCHDGNYALMDMLQGARAEDKAFAAGHGPNPATLCRLICGVGNPEYAAVRMRGRGYAVEEEPESKPQPKK